MEALVHRGMTVQPFKVGPDFIDPTHHSAICGRVSRNLDPFMMGEEGTVETFVRASRGADIAVIEGVMGMYDGMDGGDVSSTAQVMRLLSAPGILVVDVKGMSRSAHALVRGYVSYDPVVRLAGVIYNRVGSDRHRALIESRREVRAFGYIPRSSGLEVGSRHLGLQMARETGRDPGLGGLMEACCDIAGVLESAERAPELPELPGTTEYPGEHVRIGVAQDPAFCFYYQDNLDRLAAGGAALCFFSPMEDPFPDVDAVYLGGGYPELHAQELSSSPCRERFRAAADDGMPVFAECGGLLYLCEALFTPAYHRMAGIIPARGEMTGTIQGLGYSDGSWEKGPRLAIPGRVIRGHEFHYSRIECDPDARFAIRLSRGKGILDGKDGIWEREAVATYTHSYFSPEFADSFVRAAAGYRKC
jgi:cobyrinic acid a,c-diamide synthase